MRKQLLAYPVVDPKRALAKITLATVHTWLLQIKIYGHVFNQVCCTPRIVISALRVRGWYKYTDECQVGNGYFFKSKFKTMFRVVEA